MAVKRLTKKLYIFAIFFFFFSFCSRWRWFGRAHHARHIHLQSRAVNRRPVECAKWNNEDTHAHRTRASARRKRFNDFVRWDDWSESMPMRTDLLKYYPIFPSWDNVSNRRWTALHGLRWFAPPCNRKACHCRYSGLRTRMTRCERVCVCECGSRQLQTAKIFSKLIIIPWNN